MDQATPPSQCETEHQWTGEIDWEKNLDFQNVSRKMYLWITWHPLITPLKHSEREKNTVMHAWKHMESHRMKNIQQRANSFAKTLGAEDKPNERSRNAQVRSGCANTHPSHPGKPNNSPYETKGKGMAKLSYQSTDATGTCAVPLSLMTSWKPPKTPGLRKD